MLCEHTHLCSMQLLVYMSLAIKTSDSQHLVVTSLTSLCWSWKQLGSYRWRQSLDVCLTVSLITLKNIAPVVVTNGLEFSLVLVICAFPKTECVRKNVAQNPCTNERNIEVIRWTLGPFWWMVSPSDAARITEDWDLVQLSCIRTEWIYHSVANIAAVQKNDAPQNCRQLFRLHRDQPRSWKRC